MLYKDECVLRRNASHQTAVVRGVMAGQPPMFAMRDVGIQMIGVDERPTWRRWGDASCFLIFIVLKGRLHYENQKGGRLQADPGQALLLPPDASKQVESHEHAVEAIWVHLDPNGTLLKSLASANQPNVRLFPPAELARTAVLALFDEAVVQHPDSGEACLMLCRLLVHYMQRHLGSHESVREQTFRSAFSAILRDIYEHPNADWSVSMLAARLNMSEGHFHRTIRSLYAASPASIVQQIRLDKASELLRTTDFTLEGIAVEVGYSNAYNFSEAFTHAKGVRPGEFRKSFHA